MAPNKSLAKLPDASKRKVTAAAALVAKTVANAEIRRKAAMIARVESPDYSALRVGISEAPVDRVAEEAVKNADTDTANQASQQAVDEAEEDTSDDDKALCRGPPATSSDIEEDVEGTGHDEEDDDDAAGALGIRVEEVPQPRTPVKRRRARNDPVDDAPAAKRNYKVVLDEFSPLTCKLAAVSKKRLRRETVMGNPYPGTVSRFGAIYAIVKDTALTSKFSTPETRGAFAHLESDDPVVKDRFITLVGYGRGMLMNNVIKKARGELGALGVPGNYSAQALQDKISWLTKTEAYKFGGLNLASESFDPSQPFMADFFGNLARILFLEGRGNGDSEILDGMMDVQLIPKSMNALFITAVEHALFEWREGTHKTTNFKEDLGSRYMYHLGGWEKLEQEAPRYALMVQQDIFKKILMQTNKLFLLDSTLEAGVMSNLDFVALEAIAANDF